MLGTPDVLKTGVSILLKKKSYVREKTFIVLKKKIDHEFVLKSHLVVKKGYNCIIFVLIWFRDD